MNIGDRIKQRRIELGLDADELASRIGKSRATVYRYENGDIENMPTTVLEPIAKALNTTPAYLMGWEDPRRATIATRIKNLQAQKNYTIDRLAKRCSLSIEDLTAYENALATPSVTELEKIASALDTTLQNIIGWDNSLTYEQNLLKLPPDLIMDYDDAPVKLSAKQILDVNWNLTFTTEEYTMAELKLIAEFAKFLKNSRNADKEQELKEDSLLKAAHERTDIEVTDEMRKHDDDIMNDDSEWE